MAALALVAPIYLLAILGYAAGRLGILPKDATPVLNRFVFMFAMPAFIFEFFATSDPLSAEEWRFAAGYALAALAVFATVALTAAMAFRLDARRAGALAFGGALGNAVFLGLPIVVQIEPWVRPYLTLVAGEGLVIVGLGAAVMSLPDSAGARGAGAVLAAMLRAMRTPVVAASIAGLATAYLNFAPPAFLLRAVDMLGNAAAPSALMALGLHFASAEPVRLRKVFGRVALIAFSKLALLPATVWLVLTFILPVPASERAVAVFFTSMPTAVGAFVFASAYRVCVDEIAAALVAVTMIAVILIPAYLAWLAPL